MAIKFNELQNLKAEDFLNNKQLASILPTNIQNVGLSKAQMFLDTANAAKFATNAEKEAARLSGQYDFSAGGVGNTYGYQTTKEDAMNSYNKVLAELNRDLPKYISDYTGGVQRMHFQSQTLTDAADLALNAGNQPRTQQGIQAGLAELARLKDMYEKQGIDITASDDYQKMQQIFSGGGQYQLDANGNVITKGQSPTQPTQPTSQPVNNPNLQTGVGVYQANQQANQTNQQTGVGVYQANKKAMTGTDTNLQQTVEQQAQTLGNSSMANKEYVNALFKAYHGRDANAQELEQYTQMGVQDALNAIKGGSPANQAKPTDVALNKADTDIQNVASGITSQDIMGQNKSLTDVVKELSTAMGFTEINDEMEKLDMKYAEDVMDINNNPWISEALRSKKIANLQSSYETKKDALVDRLALESDIVSKAVDYYNKEREYKQQMLFKQLDLQEKELDRQQEMLIAEMNKQQMDFTTIGKDEYGNDIYGFVDEFTGNIIPSSVSQDRVSSSFSDADGTVWNISGWATDQTKAQQMQDISNAIGKVDDNNIEQKVSQFTPGITADMIKETSAKTGVSWEALMTMVAQESIGGTSNVAKKNNNYGGLTFNNQEWIKEFGGTIGTARPSAEGGNYIKFPTPQAGLDAMGALMANYGTVDKSPTSQFDQEVAGLVEQVKSGSLDPQNIQNENVRRAVQNAMIGQRTKQEDLIITNLQDRYQDLETLKTHKGLKGSVGAYGIARWTPLSPDKAERQDFIATIEQLTSQDTLQTLINLKKAGGTLGAVSETELLMLQNASTKINSWAIKKDGKTIGYEVSEELFKQELDNLKKATENILKSVDASPEISDNNSYQNYLSSIQ